MKKKIDFYNDKNIQKMNLKLKANIFANNIGLFIQKSTSNITILKQNYEKLK